MAHHTERASCKVTVKEGVGTVFLAFETGFLKSLGSNGMITLDLREGTSMAQARKIAATFNESIEAVAVTFDVPEINQTKPF